jgi:hypothetical protein
VRGKGVVEPIDKEHGWGWDLLIVLYVVLSIGDDRNSC